MNLPAKVNPQYINLVLTKPINLLVDTLEFTDGFYYLTYCRGKASFYTKHFCAN